MRVGKAEVGRGGEEGGGVVLGRGERGGVVLAVFLATCL